MAERRFKRCLGESLFLKEQRALAEARGEAKARLRVTRDYLTEVLIHRFGVSSKHEEIIGQIEDQERLDRMWESQFTVSSWDGILAIK